MGLSTTHLGDLSGFMVAAQEVYSLWVTQFEANKKGNGFNAIIASIYEIWE